MSLTYLYCLLYLIRYDCLFTTSPSISQTYAIFQHYRSLSFWHCLAFYSAKMGRDSTSILVHPSVLRFSSRSSIFSLSLSLWYFFPNSHASLETDTDFEIITHFLVLGHCMYQFSLGFFGFQDSSHFLSWECEKYFINIVIVFLIWF